MLKRIWWQTSKCTNVHLLSAKGLKLQKGTMFQVLAFSSPASKFCVPTLVNNVKQLGFDVYARCTLTLCKNTSKAYIFLAGLSIKVSCHTVFEGAHIWELELHSSNIRPATQWGESMRPRLIWQLLRQRTRRRKHNTPLSAGASMAGCMSRRKRQR